MQKLLLHPRGSFVIGFRVAAHPVLDVVVACPEPVEGMTVLSSVEEMKSNSSSVNP
jgi:hypothetical protein